MALRILTADIERDRDLLVETLLHSLAPVSDGRRFDWMYRNNPCGPALAWLAYDDRRSRAVGAAAAFPRYFRIQDQAVAGHVLGDFCVHAGSRTLGPAMMLQRECLAGVNSAGSLYYDFPSAPMTAVYRRLGIKASFSLVRYAKPLRADRRVSRWVKPQAVARGLSAVANRMLALRDFRLARDAGPVVQVHEGPCGEEFTALSCRISPYYGVCVHRSSEYLNWRYLKHPFVPTAVLTAREKGDLMGYVVYSIAGGEASLLDCFGALEAGVMASLIRAVVSLARKRRLLTVSVELSDSHPWALAFKREGFYRRERHPVVAHAGSALLGKRRIDLDRDLCLTGGDRDI